ncbi:protein of unknown function [Pseudomonas sp. JV551A1]|nr:protein of unknown function [Pseudomonas sp. JV551A1]
MLAPGVLCIPVGNSRKREPLSSVAFAERTTMDCPDGMPVGGQLAQPQATVNLRDSRGSVVQSAFTTPTRDCHERCPVHRPSPGSHRT